MILSLRACGRRTDTAGSRRQPGGGADLAEFAGDLAPGLAGILADVDLTEQAARHDSPGIRGRRGRAPPGRIAAAGTRQAAPGPAHGVRTRTRTRSRGTVL